MSGAIPPAVNGRPRSYPQTTRALVGYLQRAAALHMHAIYVGNTYRRTWTLITSDHTPLCADRDRCFRIDLGGTL